jgi:heat shock protein HslJ
MRKLFLLVTSIGILSTSISCKNIEKMSLENEKQVVAVSLEHSSQTALDWSGNYEGTLPCADCEGIRTLLVLNKDQTFILKTQYLGKVKTPFESKGSIIWSADGNIITLKSTNNYNIRYQVGENKLWQLDQNGEKISGELADHYILNKQANPITEKYWKLVSLKGKPIDKEKKTIKEPFFILKLNNDQIVGHGGCNSFSGKYELKEGNRIIISKLMSTLMACPANEIEIEFVKILESVDNYTIQGDTLFLQKARMAPLARFESVYL